MINVGIIGVTGYTGGELLRLLYSHPKVNIKKVSSRSNKGNSLTDNHKHLYKKIEIVEGGIENIHAFIEGLDVVFLALPHGTTSGIVKKVKGKIKVVDLSADFRLKDLKTFEKWYQVEHHCPEVLQEAVYGIPELFREDIKQADVIANPGCYPTSIILGTAPLLDKGIVKKDLIIADSKSGVSGAGKKPSEKAHYPEINENFYAYNLGKHRHTPEIQQELSEIAKDDSLKVIFTPHLVPMSRGILSTIYLELDQEVTKEDLNKLYEEYYKDEDFIRIRKDDLPQTKYVSGSNFCDIGFEIIEGTNRVVVVSAIDNLVKGAAGQAIQNMNLMFGFDEELGIDLLPVFP